MPRRGIGGSLTAHALLVPLAVALPLLGCRGKLVATAELHAAGSATVHFTMPSNGLKIWAELKGKWVGGPDDGMMPVTYAMSFRQHEKRVGQAVCGTASSTGHLCSVLYNVFGHHTSDCEVEFPCAVPTLSPGDVEFLVEGTPAASVTQVDDISLLIREK